MAVHTPFNVLRRFLRPGNAEVPDGPRLLYAFVALEALGQLLRRLRRERLNERSSQGGKREG